MREQELNGCCPVFELMNGPSLDTLTALVFVFWPDLCITMLVPVAVYCVCYTQILLGPCVYCVAPWTILELFVSQNAQCFPMSFAMSTWWTWIY